MRLVDFLTLFTHLPSYIIEVGVLAGNSKRKSKVNLGITNAQLMYIHENGSPLKSIPARPVLQMTIEWANSSGIIQQTIDKAVNAYFSTGKVEAIDKEMEKFCLRLQNYARQIIYSNDGRLVENAPSTIKRKGDNHPLFDTGQLARSITCRYVRINK